MFGALRWSKDVQDNLEYFDLSGNRSVTGRSFYPTPICDQCREKKLECSGDYFDCQACQDSLCACTYNGLTRSTIPVSSKQLHVNDKHSPTPSTKGQQTEMTFDYRRRAVEDMSSIQTDKDQPLLLVDFEDGMWRPVTHSRPIFIDFQDWTHCHPKEPKGVDDNLSAFHSSMMSMPEIHEAATTTTTQYSVTNGQASSTTDSDIFSSGDHCQCIRSLVDMLQRIGGDGGDIDDLLAYLSDGIETCQKTLACCLCSICTNNSMLVAAIMQQLAAIAQDLQRQLLAYVHNVDNMSSTSSTAFSSPTATSTIVNSIEVDIGTAPTVDICIGKYQVRATKLHIKSVLLIGNMHLRDLQQLLAQMREEVVSGTRAAILLGEAAEIIEAAVDFQS